jgi:tetratricopeptide (TPR) repeat protein
VQNYRTVALLGLWRLTGELDYLDRAVLSAKSALALNPPPTARIVSHFCLASKALVREDMEAEKILSTFIEATGGENAPGAARAAGLMLSLEAHSRAPYRSFRHFLLSRYSDDPATWRVSSFFLDPSASAQLFEKAIPGTEEPPSTGAGSHRRLSSDLTLRDGRQVVFSDKAGGPTRLIAFLEQPGDPNAAKEQKQVVDFLIRTVSNRPLKDLELIGVFRGEDPDRLEKTMTRNKWSFGAAGLSEETWGRLCAQYGIVAADRVPNVFLVRPDGAIRFALQGVGADMRRRESLVTRIETALRNEDLALAEQALEERNYRAYAARLETSLPPGARRHSRRAAGQVSPSMHRRKLVWAYMKTEEWERALKAIEANVTVHEKEGSYRQDWCGICYWDIYRLAVRAELLRKMGKKAEAEEALGLAKVSICPPGRDMAPLLTKVKEYIATKSSRFRNPESFFADEERSVRGQRQNLYGFTLQSDLLMRAQILEKLGRDPEAAADRKRAEALAWPYPPREYDLSLLHESAVRRREAARADLANGQAKPALEKLNRNVQIHEAEPIRCNSECRICGNQVQSFQFHARTLKELGRTEEAEASLAMAKDAQCPPGARRESFKYFPINRMYGGGAGLNRLNFIEAHMRGEVYADKVVRQHRMELAGDLILRAQALEQRGDSDRAAKDRKRAVALAFPVGPTALSSPDGLPERYEELLFSE